MNLGDGEIGESEGIVRIFVVELLVDFFRIGETAFTNQRASFLRTRYANMTDAPLELPQRLAPSFLAASRSKDP